MCAEICGNRDALDDHIANALSVLAEDIVIMLLSSAAYMLNIENQILLRSRTSLLRFKNYTQKSARIIKK
ncbi:MAG: hypothetical protein ACK55Z_16440, partial [bacterium]